MRWLGFACASRAENIPAGVCVFASNHASNIDPVALVPNIPRRVALLAKKEVFRIPILSKAMHLAKLVPVDRADKEAAAESVDIAVEISEGRPCPFWYILKEHVARRPSAPIQEGNFRDGHPRRRARGARFAGWDAATDAQRRLDLHPGEVVVRYGPPVNASEYSPDQRDELRQRVQELVAAGLPEDQKPWR